MPQGGPGGFTERVALLQVLVDQVGDDFGIRLGTERPSFVHEFVAQLKIVFDNAVVDNHHVAGAVRMCVLFGRRPMGRPAGMTDTDRTGQGFGLEEPVKLGELADRPPDGNMAVREGGDSCGVVAAILKPLESLEEERGRLALPNISHNAAHGGVLPNRLN